MFYKLFEDIFDDEENINSVISDNVEDDTDGEPLFPKHHVCWYVSIARSLWFVMRPFKPSELKKLQTVMDSFRYIDNIRLCVSGKNLSDDEYQIFDLFEYTAQAPVDTTQQKNADVLHIFFDYDESRNNDVAFMSNVLVDLMTMLVQFMRIYAEPSKYNIELTYWAKPENGADKTVAHELALNIQPDIHDIKKGNVNKELADKMESVLFNIGSPLTADTIFKFFNKRYKVSKTFMKAFYDMNAPVSLLKKINVIEDNKTKRREIIIPENAFVSLKGLNLALLARETKTEKLEMKIDGTLEISSIEEFENLEYLSKYYEHNKLIVNMFISMKMLRWLLCGRFFKEIDFSHCDLPDEVMIDMDFKLVQNRDMVLIPNSQMTIKNI